MFHCLDLSVEFALLSEKSRVVRINRFGSAGKNKTRTDNLKMFWDKSQSFGTNLKMYFQNLKKLLFKYEKVFCPNLKMYLSLLPIICKKYKVCLYKSRLVRINRGCWARKNKTWTDRCCGNRKLLEGPSTSGSCWRRHHRSSQPTTQPRSTQDKISSFLRRSLYFISNPHSLNIYTHWCFRKQKTINTP